MRFHCAVLALAIAAAVSCDQQTPTTLSAPSRAAAATDASGVLYTPGFVQLSSGRWFYLTAGGAVYRAHIPPDTVRSARIASAVRAARRVVPNDTAAWITPPPTLQ